MSNKRPPKTYTSDDVDVTYDMQRCIHAAECVKRLNAVFDTAQRPWIQPTNASADDVAETIEHCPTGALHYNRKDGGAQEAIPSDTTLEIVENGPIYLHGDLQIVDENGNEVLQDTRVALCRCGASQHKPFCDLSHTSAEFKATDKLDENMHNSTEITGNGKLMITPTSDGPVHIEGNFSMTSSDGETTYTSNDAWLCRCGASKNKPFCDGSHHGVNFKSE